MRPPAPVMDPGTHPLSGWVGGQIGYGRDDVAVSHPFQQMPDVSVRVCNCGKWPDHHVHTNEPRYCSCDDCRLAHDHREEWKP